MLRLARPNVMIVDDDPLVLIAVGGMLRHLNCEICTAGNGATAVEETLRRNGPQTSSESGTAKIDLIVMDANMPVMNGYDAARRIGDLHREGKISAVDIVCLSAQESELHADLCKASGMQHISINAP